TAKKRVQPANESCEFCAASGLTTPSRLWKSSRAKLGPDISWFMVPTAFIVRWLRDLSAYRPLRDLIVGKVKEPKIEVVTGLDISPLTIIVGRRGGGALFLLCGSLSRLESRILPVPNTPN